MCQSWFYKAANPPLRKADNLSLAIGDIVCGWIAIEYSYKVGHKMNINFCANMAGFCRDSHIYPQEHTQAYLQTYNIMLKISL